MNPNDALIAVNAALVLVTIIYAIITKQSLDAAVDTAESSRLSAEAAARSAEAAEQGLRISSTPVVVWRTLDGKVNPADLPEFDYSLHNVSQTAALKISVALVRYPVDGPPIETPFRYTAGALYPGATFPVAGAQDLQRTVPAEGDDLAQWIHAVGNDSYGVIVTYGDIAGRWWRTEMRRNDYGFSIEEIDEPQLAG